MNDLNRRDFVRGLLAGSVVWSATGCSRVVSAADPPIALQLYSVRELTRNDFQGTLRRVAEIGYKHFEFAGYGNMTAPELTAFLKEIGATACGTHEGFQNFGSDAEKVIAFNKALGNPYVVVPSMPGPTRTGGPDGIRSFAQDLNRIGEQVKQAGMQLCYHNHSFEFEKVDGDQTIWDLLFSNADPELVKAEVDIAWVANAEIDPVEHLDRWNTRIKLLHMKDLDENKQLCPVGTGNIDMAGVVGKAREIGVEWFVVEQDRVREGKDILEEIALSRRNLAALLS